MNRWLRRAGALALLTGTACLPPGPRDDPQRVHDLRVLAVRLEPPEVEVPLDPAAEVSVEVQVLVAAPGAEVVQWTLTGCAEPSERACGDPVDPDTAEVLAPLLRSEARETLVDAWGSAAATVSRTLPAATLAALVSTSGLEGLTGARPGLEVAAQAATGDEVAYKRLQVSWPDAAWRAVLAQAGVTLCDEAGEPAGCLPYRTRSPNQNPTLSALRVRHAGSQAWEPVETPPLEVAPGEVVALRPQAGEEPERYQALSVDLETGAIEADNRQELLMYSWFATAGWFDHDVTEESRTGSADNTWEAPTNVPPEGRMETLWVVLRDSRGGVDFRAVPVRVIAR